MTGGDLEGGGDFRLDTNEKQLGQPNTDMGEKNYPQTPYNAKYAMTDMGGGSLLDAGFIVEKEDKKPAGENLGTRAEFEEVKQEPGLGVGVQSEKIELDDQEYPKPRKLDDENGKKLTMEGLREAINQIPDGKATYGDIAKFLSALESQGIEGLSIVIESLNRYTETF